MLNINPDPKFKADVEITVPGQKETGTVSLVFKYRSMKSYNEWIETMKPTKKKDKPLAEAFMEFVEEWDGLDAEYTPKNVEIFLNNYPSAYREIFTFYANSLFESRVKN